MDVEEALVIVDELLPHPPLSSLQETVFSQVWEGKTYAEIAEACNYEHNYIRDVGFRLWKALSEVLDQKISKSNIKAVLRRYARNGQGAFPTVRPIRQASPLILEFPSGPVPLNSELYIERPAIEGQAYADILKPGSLIRIKAPRQMGKTSLLRRILAHARSHQYRTVNLRFNQADRIIYQNLDTFLRWFCANVSYQLGLEPNLEVAWNTAIGSKVSCTAYFEDYILGRVDGNIVIALDEMNDLFQYPEISADFLPLLRSWYEDAREFENWQRLRWVLAHTTDVYVPLQLHQSPFNVGQAIKLPPFSLKQVMELAYRHGLIWVENDVERQKLLTFLQMVNCHPGLVRLALYALARYNLSLEQLIEEAPTQSGIYSSHLRSLFVALSPYPDLQGALRMVVQSLEPVTLEPIAAYRLESLGLISLRRNQAILSCELYRQYFLNFLPAEAHSLPLSC